VSRLLRSLLVLLLVVLAGCATRSSQTERPAAHSSLVEADVVRLISTWQARLCRYIADEGDGDLEVLSTLESLHSRNVLRPARITFGVLDVDADPPERHGWDVQGVLVGMERRSVFIRYVFAVGIVGYTGYLPTNIQDIRLVSLSSQAGTTVWEMSAADPAALARYRDTFDGRGASRFPADDDSFRMNASRDRVSVHEVRSGADWSLAVRAGEPPGGSIVNQGSAVARDPRYGCG